jgi:hypothetical protein
VAGRTVKLMGPKPIVSVADAPAGTERLDAQWINITVPDVGGLIAAVARPSGTGPFPSILLLHGSHGFAHEYVRLAQDLASGGLLSVAGCWFGDGGGAGTRFITPIVWPSAPPRLDPMSYEAIRTVARWCRRFEACRMRGPKRRSFWTFPRWRRSVELHASIR